MLLLSESLCKLLGSGSQFMFWRLITMLNLKKICDYMHITKAGLFFLVKNYPALKFWQCCSEHACKLSLRYTHERFLLYASWQPDGCVKWYLLVVTICSFLLQEGVKPLWQPLENFFCKGPDVNILDHSPSVPILGPSLVAQKAATFIHKLVGMF